MNDKEFVKIENRTMPVDNYKELDFDIEKNSQSGFTNFLFLAGIVVTAVMWIMLMVIGK